MTMTELVYVRLLMYQNNIFSDQWPCHFGQGAWPLLWVPTSPITVLASHSIVSSVKCCGPDLAHDRPANHGITGSANYKIRLAPRCI